MTRKKTIKYYGMIIRNDNFRKLLVISFPIIIGNIMTYINGLVDVFYVSKIDMSHSVNVAAIGSILPIISLVLVISNAIFFSLTAHIGNAKKACLGFTIESIFTNGVGISLFIFLVVLSTCIAFSSQIINIILGSADNNSIQASSRGYLLAVSFGLGLLPVCHAIAAYFQAVGRTSMIGIAFTVSTMANFILTPILIFWFRLGIIGAGAGTSISILFALVILMFGISGEKILRRQNLLHVLKIALMREISKSALVEFARMILGIIYSISIVMFVGRLGAESLVAMTLYTKYSEILIIPPYALATATITLVANYNGMRQYHELRKCAVAGISLTIAVSFFLYLAFIFIAPLIIKSAVADSESVAQFLKLVYPLTLCSIGVSVVTVSSAIYQGLRKPHIPLFISAVSIVVALLVLFVAGKSEGYDITDVVRSRISGLLISLVLLVIIYGSKLFQSNLKGINKAKTASILDV